MYIHTGNVHSLLVINPQSFYPFIKFISILSRTTSSFVPHSTHRITRFDWLARLACSHLLTSNKLANYNRPSCTHKFSFVNYHTSTDISVPLHLSHVPRPSQQEPAARRQSQRSSFHSSFRVCCCRCRCLCCSAALAEPNAKPEPESESNAKPEPEPTDPHAEPEPAFAEFYAKPEPAFAEHHAEPEPEPHAEPES